MTDIPSGSGTLRKCALAWSEIAGRNEIGWEANSRSCYFGVEVCLWCDTLVLHIGLRSSFILEVLSDRGDSSDWNMQACFGHTLRRSGRVDFFMLITLHWLCCIWDGWLVCSAVFVFFCLFCLKRPYCHLSYRVSETVVHAVLTLPVETCFKLIVVMTGRSTSMMP